jgi:predicted permease
MIHDIELDYDRARARGALPAAWCTIATAWDLLRGAVTERISPSWTPAQHSSLEDPAMAGKEWLYDLRFAVRTLRRSAGFTAISVGTLGLAIGATAAMFAVVNAVLIKPLPYANVDRIVQIHGLAPGSDFTGEFGLGSEFYVQYREQSRLIENISSYNSFTNTLRYGDRVERLRMSWPTSTLFATLGAKPILGRLPNAEDEDRAVVISHELWLSWFSGDSSVIGKTVNVGRADRTIIGVMAPEFKFPNDGTLLWISNTVRPEGIRPGNFSDSFVARMKPGVTTDELARELTALSRRLPDRFGGSPGYARIIARHQAVVRTISDALFGNIAGSLWVLLGAVGIVLLIACANVANLFMVRAEGRQRDLAVRRAIGAGRPALIRSQMSEALVVAGAAGVIATALAWAGLPVLLRFAPQNVPRLDEVHLDAPTLLFTLGISALAALACGLAPAIRASAPDLTRLREGGRGSTRRRGWARDGLVVAQTALALVLLIGSGLLVRSFRALREVDPGYSTKDLFTFQIAPEGPTLVDGPTFARFDHQFMDRLRQLPGVETVGLVENVPLNESTASQRFRTEDMGADTTAGTLLHYTFEAGDYFKAMGIRVIAGRPLEENDHFQNLRNVVVSQSAANVLWPGKDAIGRRVQRNGLTSWETVVGVVGDVKQDNFRDPGQAVVYFPLTGPTPGSWAINSPAYVVKTRRAETIAPEIRMLVHEMAPSAPMYRMFTMAGLARDSMTQLSFTLLTLGIASVLALILGAVGLYGVLSYIVAQRTREIGVRMALGAAAERVRWMVVAQGARVVGVGVVIGVVAALMFTRALGSLLFGVKAVDVQTFVGVSLLMVVIGLVASYLPARRASKVDPIESLRGD